MRIKRLLTKSLGNHYYHKLRIYRARLLYYIYDIRFIHIPKNGGSYVSKLFYGVPIGHFTYLEVSKKRKKFFFAIHRDPIERLMSSINYALQHQNSESNKYNGPRLSISNIEELNSFLMHELKILWGSDPVFTFQNVYLSGGEKHIKLIKFSELDKTLKNLGFSIASKQISKNRSKSVYNLDDLNEEVIVHLKEFFECDYQLLNDFQVVKF